MGNVIHNRPPETDYLSVPLIRTPLSNMTAQFGHADGNEECFPFQLRFIDCCEAYGSHQAKQKCKYFAQDYIECRNRWKQNARQNDMWAQQYHLYYKGFIGKGPRVNLYYETPRYDGYSPYFNLEDTHLRF